MKSFNFIFLSLLLLVSTYAQSSSPLNTTIHQGRVSFCSTNQDCNEAFIFPFLQCISGQCKLARNRIRYPPGVAPVPGAKLEDVAGSPSGTPCVSIRQCELGLVCVGGNPRGTCQVPKGIIGLSHLIVNLIQEDYTPGGETNAGTDIEPVQGGPLLTSRAIAIVHLSAHDAYAYITGEFAPRLGSRQSIAALRINQVKAQGGNIFRDQAEFAMFSAGLFAAKSLYPASTDRIDAIQSRTTKGAIKAFVSFGELIARQWLLRRRSDPKIDDLFDNSFKSGPFRHRPDPNFPIVQNTQDEQPNFGRVWAGVKPLELSNVRTQAFLKRFPGGNTKEYRDNLDEVKERGQCNSLTTPSGVPLTDIGVFWGYDGAPLIGTPPRLYLQVILAVKELNSLPLGRQLRALTATSVAMFDVGIAAWLWKFEYDLWRPVIGIREDSVSPDTDWNPIGVALSNLVRDPRPPECQGVNPDFPAYPSGHASFGTAAFSTLARMLRKRPSDITVKFTSDEFNGETSEGTTGKVRRVFTQTFNLAQGIQQNKDARVYLGVHWRFDSDGGEDIGEKVARIISTKFRF